LILKYFLFQQFVLQRSTSLSADVVVSNPTHLILLAYTLGFFALAVWRFPTGEE
jgi:hypothetical protein